MLKTLKSDEIRKVENNIRASITNLDSNDEMAYWQNKGGRIF